MSQGQTLYIYEFTGVDEKPNIAPKQTRLRQRTWIHSTQIARQVLFSLLQSDCSVLIEWRTQQEPKTTRYIYSRTVRRLLVLSYYKERAAA